MYYRGPASTFGLAGFVNLFCLKTVGIRSCRNILTGSFFSFLKDVGYFQVLSFLCVPVVVL